MIEIKEGRKYGRKVRNETNKEEEKRRRNNTSTIEVSVLSSDEEIFNQSSF